MPEYIVRQVTVTMRVEVKGAVSDGEAADRAVERLQADSLLGVKVLSVLVERK
jgi:hypothetical protein